MRRRYGSVLLALLWLGGCASSGGGIIPRGGRATSAQPWQIPASAYPSQHLFRVKYDGPEGRAGFKLTLYLQGETFFRMRAADTLGRRVWELAVDENDEALWLDHRNKQYCVSPGASRLAIVPLARLPLVALPKLLLGHLPATPASELQRTEVSVYFRDVRGQLWNGGLADGRLEWWTLVEAGEAVTWWRREGDESIFVDLKGEQQLRWREVVSEPLAQAPAPLTVPPRYTEAACS